MDPIAIALLLYLAAVALAVLDLFVPSGGMLILLACVLALAAVLFGFRSSTTAGMAMLTLVVTSVPVFVFAAIRIWPLTPIGRRIILKLPDAKEATRSDHGDSLESLVGLVVVSDSELRPGGQLKIDGRKLNAVAQSGIVESGQNVEIVAVRERNLIVRLTDRAPAPRSQPLTTTQVDDSPTSLLDVPADQFGLDSIDEP